MKINVRSSMTIEDEKGPSRYRKYWYHDIQFAEY